MLDTDLDGIIGFNVIGPSEDAYAGSAVAGIRVRLFGRWLQAYSCWAFC